MSLLHFCAQCDNIMNPKESRAENKLALMYRCERCNIEVESSSSVVVHLVGGVEKKSQLDQTSSTFSMNYADLPYDVLADVTLPVKPHDCPCGHGLSKLFQLTGDSDEGMTLVKVCCNPDCKRVTSMTESGM